MLFIGVDLAWSPKNGTAIAILKGDKEKAKLIDYKTNLISNEEIINYIKEKVTSKNALIAIDAPLIVKNERGRRIAEKLVGFLFRKYDAGAHPANRKRLSQWGGKIRGEEISRLLEINGFKHDPYIKKFERTRKFFEVYPHPSMVVIFNLKKIIQYKAKPKRDYKFRWQEFRRYQTYLKNLEKRDPKLILPIEILEKKVEELRSNALKEYEDLLDSIFCAYIAYYTWFYPEKCAVLGNMNEGYILTPVFESMKNWMNSIEK
jgi:predicted RNase H-like nuclease